MAKMKEQTLFEKYPRLTLAAVIVFILTIVDFVAGTVFIPFDYNSYRSPDPWFHHGLRKNMKTMAQWGNDTYPMITNSMGFRDGANRIIDAKDHQKKYLIMGDSFLEGVGVPWDESVAGLLTRELAKNGIEVYNSAVVSYSPILYYLKLKYLIEQKGFVPDHVFVFPDNSDPLNEITYKDFKPWPNNRFKAAMHSVKRFLYHNSYSYYSITTLIRSISANPITNRWNRKMGSFALDETETASTEFLNAFPLWSHDKMLLEKYGRPGLKLAEENMKKLVLLCNSYHIGVTLVIYPWPPAIQGKESRNIQEDFWQDFSKKHSTGFLNLYPLFKRAGPPEQVLKDCFIPGDVHWNRYGNRFVASYVLSFIHDYE